MNLNGNAMALLSPSLSPSEGERVPKAGEGNVLIASANWHEPALHPQHRLARRLTAGRN